MTAHILRGVIVGEPKQLVKIHSPAFMASIVAIANAIGDETMSDEARQYRMQLCIDETAMSNALELLEKIMAHVIAERIPSIRNDLQKVENLLLTARTLAPPAPDLDKLDDNESSGRLEIARSLLVLAGACVSEVRIMMRVVPATADESDAGQ